MAAKWWLLARFERSSGVSKDWAIAVKDDEVLVRFATTGRVLQKRSIARTTWRRQDAESEARRRLQEQVEQGYVVLGTCTFSADGKVADLISDPNADIPVHGSEQGSEQRPQDADVYFEVIAASWQVLFETMEASVDRLAQHYDCRWVSRQGLPTAVPIIDGWSPAFNDHNGQGEVRHHGSLRRINGVGALLFLLTLRHLARESVKVSLVKADGGEIGKDIRKEADLFATFESSLDLVTDAAEDIGLIPKKIRLSQVDTGQADYWF